MKYENIRQQVLDAILEAVDLGLIHGTSGNIAVRDPEEPIVAITPSGIPYKTMTLEQIAIVDLNTGEWLDGIYKPSSEVPMHTAVMDWFKKMKPTAYVVNTARAAVIDQKSFVEALQSGIIAGAALDVYWKEPIPANHPLLNMTNSCSWIHSAYARAWRKLPEQYTMPVHTPTYSYPTAANTEVWSASAANTAKRAKLTARLRKIQIKVTFMRCRFR